MPPKKQKQAPAPVAPPVEAVQTVSATLALQEREIQSEINAILFEILDNGVEAAAVTQVHVKSLTQIFAKQPRLFQAQFLNLIDRIVCLEAEDVYLRNFFRLIDKFYAQVLSQKHKESKSVANCYCEFRWNFVDEGPA
jgi:hypothetical protein